MPNVCVSVPSSSGQGAKRIYRADESLSEPKKLNVTGSIYGIKFRVIGIRSDLATDITLMDGDKPAEGRIVAKDGMTMPAHQVVTRPAHLILAAGETYDIQVTPRPVFTRA